MPLIKGREYRAFGNMLLPATESTTKRLDSNFYVEGYATTFDRYLLYEYGGIKYYEEIAPTALDGADTQDIIMQYNHHGKVLARVRNGTLGIEVNAQGLFIFADLSKSKAAKELCKEIDAGLIDRMSWAFSIEKESYERISDTERLRRIEKIKKVYDVSAVSLPANEGTEIYARGFEALDIDKGEERLGLQLRLLKLKINMEVGQNESTTS